MIFEADMALGQQDQKSGWVSDERDLHPARHPSDFWIVPTDREPGTGYVLCNTYDKGGQ